MRCKLSCSLFGKQLNKVKMHHRKLLLKVNLLKQHKMIQLSKTLLCSMHKFWICSKLVDIRIFMGESFHFKFQNVQNFESFSKLLMQSGLKSNSNAIMFSFITISHAFKHWIKQINCLKCTVHYTLYTIRLIYQRLPISEKMVNESKSIVNYLWFPYSLN